MYGSDIKAQEERPHFGLGQVRTPRGIKRGNILRDLLTYGRLLVLSDPKGNEEEGGAGLFFRAIVLGGQFRGSVDDFSLADAGVVPYDNNLWNPLHRLLRTGTKRLTEGEIEQLESEIGGK